MGALHFGVFLDEKQSVGLIHEARDLGVNFIDTAPMYGSGHSEGFVGKAINGKRDAFIIASKVGLEPITNENGAFGVRTFALTEVAIRSGVERSLRALNTDYLDLLQLHAFDPQVSPDETLNALERLVSEGKIRYYGCTSYDADQLKLMQDSVLKNRFQGFASLQAHYNLMERRLEEELVPLCNKWNLGIICYRALNRGILGNKYHPSLPPPAGSRAAVSERVRQRMTTGTLLAVKQLEELANRHGRKSSDLAIAWLQSRPGVCVLNLGMRNSEQLRQNVLASEWILTEDEIESVDVCLTEAGLMDQVRRDPAVFLET